MDQVRELRLLAVQLAHYEGWFGTECRCDDDPCPLTLTPDPPSVAERAVRDFHRYLDAGGSQPWAVWWDRYRDDYPEP